MNKKRILNEKWQKTAGNKLIKRIKIINASVYRIYIREPSKQQNRDHPELSDFFLTSCLFLSRPTVLCLPSSRKNTSSEAFAKGLSLQSDLEYVGHHHSPQQMHSPSQPSIKDKPADELIVWEQPQPITGKFTSPSTNTDKMSHLRKCESFILSPNFHTSYASFQSCSLENITEGRFSSQG